MITAAVQMPMNCHRQLEKRMVRDIEPVVFIVQYLTQAVVELLCAGHYACIVTKHLNGLNWFLV